MNRYVQDFRIAPRWGLGHGAGLSHGFPALAKSSMAGFAKPSTCSLGKRVLDVSLASTLLCLLAPLLLLIACSVRVTSPGPAIFRQTRLGLGGKPFRIFKFRTMRVMENGPLIRQATRHDERTTRIGRLLRRTSLDELPQLMNVLAGDMSLVGPRPHAVAHDIFYALQIPDYTTRMTVHPGITGWAQVNGARGETPALKDMRRRVSLDIWYIEHWSIRLDLSIIAKTAVMECLGKRCAY